MAIASSLITLGLIAAGTALVGTAVGGVVSYMQMKKSAEMQNQALQAMQDRDKQVMAQFKDMMGQGSPSAYPNMAGAGPAGPNANYQQLIAQVTAQYGHQGGIPDGVMNNNIQMPGMPNQ